MTQQVNLCLLLLTSGLPRWLSGKEFACQGRRQKFDPWVGKIPWRRKWQPTPVCLPGKFHGQRSLAGYSPLGCKESDTPEHTTHALLPLRKDQLCFQRQPPLAGAGKHSYHPLQQAHWGVWGLPWWLSRKESTCQCRRHGSDPWSRKIPHATEQLSTRTTATEPVP